MKIVVALVLLVIGSLVFHWLSPWWMTPLASNWSAIDTTIDITPTASVAFVGVEEVQAIRSIRKIRKEYMIASTIVASIVSDALQSVMHSVGAIQSINNKNHQ